MGIEDALGLDILLTSVYKVYKIQVKKVSEPYWQN